MEISKIAVNGTLYAIKDTVTSINGKSGAIEASDIASVLTAAGYKLTDTDTNTVTSINGKTGAIAALDIASVLIADGYKLTDNNTDTTYQFSQSGNTLQMGTNGGTKSDIYTPTIPTSIPANGGNSTTVNGHTVNSDVPANALFTDTTYSAGTGLSLSGTTFNVNYGTAAGTACQGNDSRLSDSRPASDVSAWAKASTKPTYIASEVMSISTVAISANTSSSCSITGSGNAGKAQTIIYTNSGSADYTVTVPTTYSTPDGAAIELTCKAGGYCEVSYLNIGGTIYARGL